MMNYSAKVTQPRRPNWNLKPGCLEPKSVLPTVMPAPEVCERQSYTHCDVTILISTFYIAISSLSGITKGKEKYCMAHLHSLRNKRKV